MEEFIAGIVGTAVTFIISKAEKLGVKPKVAHLLVAFGVACPYVLFQMFAPEQFQKNVFDFYSNMLTVAFLVYNYTFISKKK